MKLSIFTTILIIILTLTFCGCTKSAKDSSTEKSESSTAPEVVTQEKEASDTSTSEQSQVSGGDSEAEITDNENSQAEVENQVIEETESEDNGSGEPENQGTDENEIPPSTPDNINENVYTAVTGISLSTYDVTVFTGSSTMPIVTMMPANASNKGEIWTSSDTSVATVDYLGNISGISEGVCTVTVRSVDNGEVFASVNVNVLKGAECTYIDGILIANKTYPLPQGYAPGWDAQASEALKVMFAEAEKDGISLWVKSGYRSYIDQKIIYNGYVARDGKEQADRYSARPGHSEHQTGLAFDINSTSNSFADTPEAKWLAENCYKYGFIIRYPKDKEHITGYIYEPWHVRYLGTEKAKEVFDSGLCLEEFLGITSAYTY